MFGFNKLIYQSLPCIRKMHMTVTVCHSGDLWADLDHNYNKVIIIHADQSHSEARNQYLVFMMVKSIVVSLNKTRHRIDEKTKGSNTD